MSVSELNLIPTSSLSLKDFVPFPAINCNKYTRGKLTIVGGSSKYPGAACLASNSAVFGGSGYVHVVCAKSAVPIVQLSRHSLVVSSWEGWTVKSSSLSELNNNHPQACLVGSGFSSQADLEKFLLEDVINNCQYPVVIDGGAISYFENPEIVKNLIARGKSGKVTVLTPHIGEASKLADGLNHLFSDFRYSSEDVLQSTTKNMPDISYMISKYLYSTVMLKGPSTFISCAQCNNSLLECTVDNYRGINLQNTVFEMDEGTSVLAKAGTGDVLAGLCASLLSQGLESVSACILSASLHAIAGNLASARMSIVSPGAEEVLSKIPAAILTVIK